MALGKEALKEDAEQRAASGAHKDKQAGCDRVHRNQLLICHGILTGNLATQNWIFPVLPRLFSWP
jgi:hypothetical protein